MKLSIFEEYPTEENFAKLDLLPFPVFLYIAAPSLTKWKNIRDQVSSHEAVADVGYWPILTEREGYWLSPFSQERALERVMNELEECKEELTVLWDAEPPLLRPSLFFRGLPGFVRKSRRIRKFLANAKSHGLSIVSCEYASTGSIIDWLYRCFTVSFNGGDGIINKMVMCYTSFPLISALRKRILWQISRQQESLGADYSVALGTIAQGVFGTEPILSPTDLAKDITDLRDLGVHNFALFRLGGLDEEYAAVLKEHLASAADLSAKA